VNNESSEIIRMLNSELEAVAGDDVDFYPAPLRPEIDRINDLIYRNVYSGEYPHRSNALRSGNSSRMTFWYGHVPCDRLFGRSLNG
jgi:hypothetical protein